MYEEAYSKGVTIQVGKALNDPVKGITALAKAGVSLSEDQKAMIKSLVETDDLTGLKRFIFFIELLKAAPAFVSESKGALLELAVVLVALNAE